MYARDFVAVFTTILKPRSWCWRWVWDAALLLVGSAFKVTMYHLKEKLYTDEAWLLAVSIFAACAYTDLPLFCCVNIVSLQHASFLHVVKPARTGLLLVFERTLCNTHCCLHLRTRLQME